MIINTNINNDIKIRKSPWGGTRAKEDTGPLRMLTKIIVFMPMLSDKTKFKVSNSNLATESV